MQKRYGAPFVTSGARRHEGRDAALRAGGPFRCERRLKSEALRRITPPSSFCAAGQSSAGGSATERMISPDLCLMRGADPVAISDWVFSETFPG
jgi:hypothetical protein